MLADFHRSPYESYEGEPPKRKAVEEVKEEQYSPWPLADRENSHSIRTSESPLEPEGREIYNAEQLVPGQASYQPYRYTHNIYVIVLINHTKHC